MSSENFKPFRAICEEIEAGQNLEKHLESDNKFVRRELVRCGYFLKELVSDPKEEVRAEVANAGYGLDVLTKDASPWVRVHAYDKLAALSKENAGYKIIARIQVGEEAYVLGENPDAPSPYVTWSFNPKKADYNFGHYFSSKEDALIDLTKRAEDLMDLGDKSLARELLTDADKEILKSDFSKAAAIEDITYILSDLLTEEYFEYKLDLAQVLSDDGFMAGAMHSYENIDHSFENKALWDILDEMLCEYTDSDKVKLPDGYRWEQYDGFSGYLSTPSGNMFDYSKVLHNERFCIEYQEPFSGSYEYKYFYDTVGKFKKFAAAELRTYLEREGDSTSPERKNPLDKIIQQAEELKTERSPVPERFSPQR